MKRMNKRNVPIHPEMWSFVGSQLKTWSKKPPSKEEINGILQGIEDWKAKEDALDAKADARLKKRFGKNFNVKEPSKKPGRFDLNVYYHSAQGIDRRIDDKLHRLVGRWSHSSGCWVRASNTGYWQAEPHDPHGRDLAWDFPTLKAARLMTKKLQRVQEIHKIEIVDVSDRKVAPAWLWEEVWTRSQRRVHKRRSSKKTKGDPASI